LEKKESRVLVREEERKTYRLEATLDKNEVKKGADSCRSEKNGVLAKDAGKGEKTETEEPSAW